MRTDDHLITRAVGAEGEESVPLTMDEEIYSLVIHRIAGSDHGWGKPYRFQCLFVLDYAVPDVENSVTDVAEPADERLFDDALKAALQAKSAGLPPLIFVQSFLDIYDASRQGHVQVRNGGVFIALGPIEVDSDSATVGAMFYAGHRWARWMRYRLEQFSGEWHIASAELLAVS
jgi:hypothetical protein